MPWPPVFWSSDPTVLEVSSEGVVQGRRRGSATIHVGMERGVVAASVGLRVKAGLRIAPRYFDVWDDHWYAAVGDTLQFIARYVDVNGATLDEAPAETWTSSDPGAASVSATGLVVAVTPLGSAAITASTPDGSATTEMRVTNLVAGLPATARFAHAALGVGPVTFLPSKGEPLTLSFGESLDRPISSGSFYVQTEGLPLSDPGIVPPNNFRGILQGGQHLSLYVTGDTAQTFVVGGWPEHVDVPADSGLVRLVQGWSDYGVVYLRSPGAPTPDFDPWFDDDRIPIGELPELCYFDPGYVSDYFMREAGGLDIVLQLKYGDPSVRPRISTTVERGRAVTLVLIGNSPETMGVLAFPDP